LAASKVPETDIVKAVGPLSTSSPNGKPSNSTIPTPSNELKSTITKKIYPKNMKEDVLLTSSFFMFFIINTCRLLPLVSLPIIGLH
jgi:hypothetical protein